MNIYPDKSKILSLLRKGYAVPVYKPIGLFCDAFDVYQLFQEKSYSFLFESPVYNQRIGRYSFMGADPKELFHYSLYDTLRNPLQVISKLCNRYPKFYHDENLPPFTGGLVGYVGYNTASLFDDIQLTAKRDIELPDLYFMMFETIIVYDHVLKCFAIISIASPETAPQHSLTKTLATIQRCEESIATNHINNNVGANNYSPMKKSKFKSNMKSSDYEHMVRQAKKYIKAGDIYQANLSQRLEVDASHLDPFDLYSHLKSINPSPFGGVLRLNDVSIVSCSPERLVNLNGEKVSARPIAGTVKRGGDQKQDTSLKRSLLVSPKQRAEHVMLVDLERNDLGKVCKYGSVYVDELMVLESYSHVTHIVSNVKGDIKANKNALNVLAAMFPGGTITGVPKIRCMQIIDELEPVARNIYTGSMGYIGFNGNMDMNIIIRTFLIKDDIAYVQVGAGIVADSSPEKEYLETLHKAEALIQAVKQT